MVRQLLAEHQGKLYIVYTPPYDPDANRIEWLWRVCRRIVTHNHQHTNLEELIDDSNAHFAELSANLAEVLAHIGSPFALDYDSTPQDLAA
ncbi:MAG: transposase [Chloroflexi bacterium]|nr:transposase [Chloroflexota bacterium]